MRLRILLLVSAGLLAAGCARGPTEPSAPGDAPRQEDTAIPPRPGHPIEPVP